MSRSRASACSKGEDVLTTYTFNTGVAKHIFCSICGVKSFYVPRSHPDGYSVNARCLDPGTVEAMTIEPFNGSEWESSIAKVEKHSSMDSLTGDRAR